MRLHGAEGAARLLIVGFAVLRVAVLILLVRDPFWVGGAGDVGGVAFGAALTIPGVAVAMGVNMTLRGTGAGATAGRCLVTLCAGLWALSWAELAYGLTNLWSGPSPGWGFALATYAVSTAALWASWRLEDRHAARPG